ncbi:MAG: hypothetical protein HY072_06100 [Deltaproteobacteria bacterium]|nr:hypothetical protein [Deltaproteobacteria bacterium]
MISLIFSIVEISSGIFSLTAQWFLKILSFRALVICTFIGSSVLMVLNLIPSLGLAVFLFFVMMTIPEIADVLIHAYFQKQISSETRASALSFISFVQSAVIGISYAFYGILLDKFTTRFAVALTAIFPLLSAIFAFIALYKMQISVDLEVS